MEVQGFQIGSASVDIQFIVVEQCREGQQDAVFDHDAIQGRLVEFDAVVVRGGNRPDRDIQLVRLQRRTGSASPSPLRHIRSRVHGRSRARHCGRKSRRPAHGRKFGRDQYFQFSSIWSAAFVHNPFNMDSIQPRVHKQPKAIVTALQVVEQLDEFALLGLLGTAFNSAVIESHATRSGYSVCATCP